MCMYINLREQRRGDKNWTIQRNQQHRVHKTKKNITICIGHHFTQRNTNNVNKTCALLQTTEGKDEPNIALMRKSKRTLEDT